MAKVEEKIEEKVNVKVEVSINLQEMMDNNHQFKIKDKIILIETE